MPLLWSYLFHDKSALLGLWCRRTFQLGQLNNLAFDSLTGYRFPNSTIYISDKYDWVDETTSSGSYLILMYEYKRNRKSLVTIRSNRVYNLRTVKNTSCTGLCIWKFFLLIFLFLTPLHVLFEEFISKVNKWSDRLGCGCFVPRSAQVHITSHTIELLRCISQVKAFIYFRPHSSARP